MVKLIFSRSKRYGATTYTNDFLMEIMVAYILKKFTICWLSNNVQCIIVIPTNLWEDLYINPIKKIVGCNNNFANAMKYF